MRIPNNLLLEMEKALIFLLEELKKPENDRKQLWRQEWFTATELERVVRENLGCSYWSNKKIIGLGGIPLLHHCRDFLKSKVLSGEIRADHPSNRHTCTGLRFRAVDGQFTKAEQKAKETPLEERRRRENIRHYSVGNNGNGKSILECQKNKVKVRSFFYSRRQYRPFRTTDDPTKVTCKKCQQILKKIAENNLQSVENIVRYSDESETAAT